jgi:hypothetical protein
MEQQQPLGLPASRCGSISLGFRLACKVQVLGGNAAGAALLLIAHSIQAGQLTLIQESCYKYVALMLASHPYVATTLWAHLNMREK